MTIMRKTYETPLIEIIQGETDSLLAGFISNDKGIDYGGKDTEGTQTPSSSDFGFEESAE